MKVHKFDGYVLANQLKIESAMCENTLIATYKITSRLWKHVTCLRCLKKRGKR